MWRATLRLRRPLLAAATLCSTTCATAALVSHCQAKDDQQLFSSRVTGKEPVGTTRWLKLETLSYTDQTGRARKWDMASRTTKRQGASADAVAILALIRSTDAPNHVETLVVQQFRPPVNAVTLELPAGLIDPGETAEMAAIRELKEETGYVGSVAYCSGPLAMSPGLCDETCQLVVVEVDLSLPANQRPVQQLEDTEFIKVTRVPLQNLHERVLALENEGCISIGMLHLLSFGLQLGQLGAML